VRFLFTRATCKVARVIKWLFYLSICLSIYRGVTIIYADVMHVIDTFFKTMQRIVKQCRFMDNSSLDVSERNSMAITLNIRTKSHAVRGRPTLKLERFANGSIRELYERSIYERSFTSEPSIEKYQAKPRTCTCKHNRAFRRDRETIRIPEDTLKRLRRGEGN